MLHLTKPRKANILFGRRYPVYFSPQHAKLCLFRIKMRNKLTEGIVIYTCSCFALMKYPEVSGAEWHCTIPSFPFRGFGAQDSLFSITWSNKQNRRWLKHPTDLYFVHNLFPHCNNLLLNCKSDTFGLKTKC